MNREAFFTRRPATKTIEIDGFGTVTIRKLTQAEVEKCRTEFGKPHQAGEAARYVVSRAVVDENGTRVFTDEDKLKLVEVDFDVVNGLSEEIAKFSGLITDDSSPK